MAIEITRPIQNGQELLEFLQSFPPECLAQMEIRGSMVLHDGAEAEGAEGPVTFSGNISQETEGEWEYGITIDLVERADGTRF